MANPAGHKLHVVAGTPQKVEDELCPNCWLPSLVLVPMHLLSSAGVGTVGAWQGCPGCGYRVKITP